MPRRIRQRVRWNRSGGRSRLLSGAALAALLAALLAGCAGPAASAPSLPLPGEQPAASAPASGAPASAALVEVRVFFVPGGVDPCGTVAPVVRRVVGPVDAAVALRELLAGPTPEEAAAGFTSLFGPPTAGALAGVAVVDGIARVSFHDLRATIPSASASCGSAALLAALDSTLAQLPGVRGARYSIEGDEAAFYEWLQMAPPD